MSSRVGLSVVGPDGGRTCASSRSTAVSSVSSLTRVDFLVADDETKASGVVFVRRGCLARRVGWVVEVLVEECRS